MTRSTIHSSSSSTQGHICSKSDESTNRRQSTTTTRRCCGGFWRRVQNCPLTYLLMHARQMTRGIDFFYPGRKYTNDLMTILRQFLANVNSSSGSLYVVVRPSVVCLSSVTFVRPTQAIEIFGNVFTPFGTLAIRDLCVKILRRSSQGNPSIWG